MVAVLGGAGRYGQRAPAGKTEQGVLTLTIVVGAYFLAGVSSPGGARWNTGANCRSGGLDAVSGAMDLLLRS